MKIVDINGITRECQEVVADPDFPGFIKAILPSNRNPDKPRTEWYPINDFLTLNPDLKKTIATPPPPDTMGVVTTSKTDSLKDATQKWKTNCYAGFTVWISRGTGEGQLRVVTRNSLNTLFIDKPWDTKPDKTSQFVVSHNIHDPTPQGNIIPGMENL